jgi:hypothetical protein
MTPTATASLNERLLRLESEAAVRRVVADYMALCDVPGPQDLGEALAQLFCSDAVWEGKGSRYAAKFGRLEGRAAIVGMLLKYLPPNSHFRFNAHFLAGERIDVHGDTADGYWLMQQLSHYDTAAGELIVARLQLQFRCEAGTWRIARFSTERQHASPLPTGEAVQ